MQAVYLVELSFPKLWSLQNHKPQRQTTTYVISLTICLLVYKENGLTIHIENPLPS